MARMLIRGGNPLHGTITVSGSKNSALAIMAAAGLAEEECILENVPRQYDVWTMAMILRSIGAEVWFDAAGRLHINGKGIRPVSPPYDLVRRIRASFYVAGLLLALRGYAEVPLPGGCSIGSRPVNFHIKGFEQLGAKVTIEHGCMKARAPKLTGTHYFINRASVGTTINMLLAACRAEGTTILENAAKEPEVVDVAIFLNSMGARIRGAGTDVIRIDGATRLSGVEHTIIPDRLEAATFAIAVGTVGGRVTLHNVMPEHLRSPIMKLREAGLTIEENDASLTVSGEGRMQAVDIETAVYPGFPTDLQQPFVSMLSLADGTSVVRETVFDGRFRYVDELLRMGADIKVERDTAIVRGVERLTGAPVEVTDLRAGAALMIAGLAAEGETELSQAHIIDRGYEQFDDKLRTLGADVRRVDVDEEDVPDFTVLGEASVAL
ncbi:MAG: UDP-N-acetylglucosamine 1-carboxyvinyltransferase [Firmicutes bacterium]|jgi:UDP-N-acetylglucosamine 1-carboxyvinyltransferase|nr:UDP-N-acetylglucosamine 1-carboxyvinyltransferase [Bacillota bacterium]